MRDPQPSSTGAQLIKLERLRQVQVEGWTAEHDAEHDEAQLAQAAHGYLETSIRIVLAGTKGSEEGLPRGWRWSPAWWKPSDDPIVNLVKAGALIAAEIDRLTALRPMATGGVVGPPPADAQLDAGEGVVDGRGGDDGA